MPKINDSSITNDWSAGTAITNAEFWQCRRGHIALSTAASPAATDGIILGPGQGVNISGGKTVKFRRLIPGTAEIAHEEV